MYTEAQHAWLLKLPHYKYKVECNKENVTSDSLSRRHEIDPPSVLTIVAVESDWLTKAREMVQSDSYFDEVKSKLEAGKLDARLYQERQG